MRFKIISFQFVYCVFVDSLIFFMILALIYHEVTKLEKFTFSNFSEFRFRCFNSSMMNQIIYSSHLKTFTYLYYEKCVDRRSF